MSPPVLSSLQIARVQRRVELGQPQRLRRVVDLDLGVEQPLRDGVAHQLVEHRALQREHLLVDSEKSRSTARRPSSLRVVDVEIVDPPGCAGTPA